MHLLPVLFCLLITFSNTNLLKKGVVDWTVDDVVTWLNENGFEEQSQEFYDDGIDGQVHHLHVSILAAFERQTLACPRGCSQQQICHGHIAEVFVFIRQRVMGVLGIVMELCAPRP